MTLRLSYYFALLRLDAMPFADLKKMEPASGSIKACSLYFTYVDRGIDHHSDGSYELVHLPPKPLFPTIDP